MIQTLTTYWQFLKKPKYLRFSKDKKMLANDFVWLLLLDLIFTCFIIGIYYSLSSIKLIETYEEKVDLFETYGFFGALFMASILAPLAEESIFRWQLTKRYASIYFVCLTLALIVIYLSKREDLQWSIVVFFLILSFIIHRYIKRIRISKRHQLYHRLYPYLFYYTSLLFGLIHFSNIKGLTLSDPTFLIFTSTQAFGGLSMGYIRVKHGLFYSILLHSTFNLIVFLMEFLFSYLKVYLF